MLHKKSLTDLRSIAQSFSIENVFQKTHGQLLQEIELRQTSKLPQPSTTIPRPEYDARLMNRPPAKICDKKIIEDALQIYVSGGLHLSFDDECWYMKHGKKNDSGSIRQSLSAVLRCADKVMS